MAHLVLGIGTSHTPMLNAPPTDWGRFIERDRLRPHLSKEGRPVTYDELLRLAPPGMDKELTAQVFADKHQRAMAEIERLSAVVRNARLDTLIVVGDDQKELYDDANMPAMLVYRGDSIRNVPLKSHPGPDWSRNAAARYYERDVARDYPVDAKLAGHMISALMEDFDLSVADNLGEGHGEGHAFGFVHNRLLAGVTVPIVPVFLNTYFPPNQPTPGRCYQLGQAIRKALENYPGTQRIGVLASGGLSHFTVDPELDGRVIRAFQQKDAAALASLPRAQLNSGSSEIRNWICMAGAVEHLTLRRIEYIPAYRTPAGTGTGMCFADWS